MGGEGPVGAALCVVGACYAGEREASRWLVLIGVIGCWQGFRVGSSSESVGRRTTSAVVMAIFSVIVADAVFSIFFSELGI